MAYIRKTHDEYEIHANYGNGFEYVCTAEDRADARDLKKAYDKNEPGIMHIIKTVRVKNTD